MPFIQKAGPVLVQRSKDRICRELKTTFASRYSRQISLAEALQVDVIKQYALPTIGEKFLILPNKA